MAAPPGRSEIPGAYLAQLERELETAREEHRSVTMTLVAILRQYGGQVRIDRMNLREFPPEATVEGWHSDETDSYILRLRPGSRP